jgi:N-acetylmuramoyl-L-alanine amidase
VLSGAPYETEAVGALAGKVIVVDPGHNGGNGSHNADINRQVFIGNGSKECDTTGTQTNDGYPEFDFTMDVANRLTRLLEAEDARVVLTRTDSSGWGPCITERAATGNDAHADLAISIHADGGPASGRGFHVLLPAAVPGYNDGVVAPSAAFGRVLRDTYTAQTGMPTATYIGTNGLMVRSDLGGLNLSRVPKVFLETGNMRNATDAHQLEDPAFREKIAAAVTDAMTTYLEGSG